MLLTQNSTMFQAMFDKWCKENNIETRQLSIFYYQYRPRMYTNYDSWKTASRDNEYEEKEMLEDIDIESLEKFAEEAWEEEFDEDEIRFLSQEEAYQHAETLFNRVYEKWEEKEKKCKESLYSNNDYNREDW